MNRFLRKANQRVSFGSAATLLIAVALVGQTLGFLRNRLISTNFTVVDPGLSDAFFAAFQIPDFFYYTIAAGALGVAFMPILADRLEADGKAAAWKLVNSLFNLLAVMMLAVSAIIFFFAEPLIRTLAPNLPPDHTQQAIAIMRLISLNPLFFTLAGIITSVQQTFGRFFFYAVAPLTYNLAIIVSIYIFKDHPLGIVGLGVGALAGGVLQLIIASLGLIGLGYRWRPHIRWKNQDFKEVLRQLPPRSLDQGIDQVNSIVEINRAQALGIGPISWYNYAVTLHNVPIVLLGNSVATAAFPRLVERLAQGRPDLFRRDFLRILRTILWMTAPVLIVSYFARGYLARLIFGDVAPNVSLIFGFLVVAILFRIIYAMVSRYFYAQKDTRTPLYVSVFAIALNIYLAFQLADPEAYGISGLAIAQSIVAFAEVAILFGIMIYRDRKLIDMEFWDGVLRIVSVSGFTLIAAAIMLRIFPLQIADRGFIVLGSKLASIATVTIGTHLLISGIMGMPEAQTVFRKARRMILKPVKIN